jgi:hypothetical protein
MITPGHGFVGGVGATVVVVVVVLVVVLVVEVVVVVGAGPVVVVVEDGCGAGGAAGAVVEVVVGAAVVGAAVTGDVVDDVASPCPGAHGCQRRQWRRCLPCPWWDRECVAATTSHFGGLRDSRRGCALCADADWIAAPKSSPATIVKPTIVSVTERRPAARMSTPSVPRHCE